MPEFGPSFRARKETIKSRVRDVVLGGEMRESGTVTHRGKDGGILHQETFRERTVAGYESLIDANGTGNERLVPSWVNRLADALKAEVIGAGGERIVLDLKNGKVMGIYTTNREGLNELGLKKKFYTFKVLHALFPNQYPQMYAAGKSTSLPNQFQALEGMVRRLLPEQVFLFDIKEKIEGRTLYKEREYIQESMRYGMEDDEHRQKVTERIERMGEQQQSVSNTIGFLKECDIDLHIDDDLENLIGETYIDSEASLRNLEGGAVSEGEKVKLIAHMKETGYTDDSIHSVESALGRLITLESKER